MKMLIVTSQLKTLRSATTPRSSVGKFAADHFPACQDRGGHRVDEVRVEMRDDLQTCCDWRRSVCSGISQLKTIQQTQQESLAESRENIQSLYSSLAEVMSKARLLS